MISEIIYTQNKPREYIYLFYVVILLIGLTAAIYHLVVFRESTYTTIIASLIWVIFFIINTRTFVQSSGSLKKAAIDFISAFSNKFIIQSNKESSSLIFSFILFKKVFKYEVISKSSIFRISTSTGQGSAMVGYDFNDWFLFIEYKINKDENGFIKIEDAGKKENAITKINNFIEFLNNIIDFSSWQKIEEASRIEWQYQECNN